VRSVLKFSGTTLPRFGTFVTFPTPPEELVADWEAVLNDLESDYTRCRNRLDWVAKLQLVREFHGAKCAR
jgi:hypothetical protein